MRKLIVILLVLCLLAPNVYAMEKEEISSTYAGVLLLSLAAIAGGVYCIVKAIPTSKDEEFKYGYGILGGFLLYVGTEGIIDYSITVGRAKRGIESKSDSAFLMVSMRLRF